MNLQRYNAICNSMGLYGYGMTKWFPENLGYYTGHCAVNFIKTGFVIAKIADDGDLSYSEIIDKNKDEEIEKLLYELGNSIRKIKSSMKLNRLNADF